MWRKRVALLTALLSLALPLGGEAAPVTIVGSLMITGVGGVALPPNALSGFATIANPGAEKAITYQIPPFTFPVFVDGDNGVPGNSLKLLKKNFDTTVVVTNTSGAALTIELRLFDANGTAIPTTPTPEVVVIPKDGTKVIVVSDLLG